MDRSLKVYSEITVKTDNLKPFKKGESGNPQGRKPGALSLKTYIKKWLAAEEEFKNPITKEMQRLTQYDIIVIQQIAKARKGDTRAFEALLDRVEGKPKQSIEMETDLTWNETKTYVNYAGLSEQSLRDILKNTKTVNDEISN